MNISNKAMATKEEATSERWKLVYVGCEVHGSNVRSLNIVTESGKGVVGGFKHLIARRSVLERIVRIHNEDMEREGRGKNQLVCSCPSACPVHPACEECGGKLRRYYDSPDTGKDGWSCDACGWSWDDGDILNGKDYAHE